MWKLITENKFPDKRLVIALALLAFLSRVAAQSPKYPVYDLNTFLQFHTLDSAGFRNTLRENFEYPPILRENGIEGLFDISIVHHGLAKFEAITAPPYERLLKRYAPHVFHKAVEAHPSSADPYEVKIKIHFDLAPYDSMPDPAADFWVKMPKVIYIQSSSGH